MIGLISVLIMNIYCSILVTEEGITIRVKEERPDKASLSILFADEGIAICFNDEHHSKALLSILVTEEGIVKEVLKK